MDIKEVYLSGVGKDYNFYRALVVLSAIGAMERNRYSIFFESYSIEKQTLKSMDKFKNYAAMD